MSRTIKKYIPKWKLTKYFHDKMMVELEENQKEKVTEVEEKTEQQKLLDKFDDPAWLYDNMLITYEEYLNRKNAR